MPALVRAEAIARTTRTNTYVEDTHHSDSYLDPDGGRWATVCEPHGSVCNHETLELALYFRAHPEEWCEFCNGQAGKDLWTN